MDLSTWMERDLGEDEVKVALNSLAGEKSPRPDGLPMIVYKKCWYFMKDEIMAAVKELQNNSFINWRHNTTYITLAPKVVGASSLSDYSPISL
ncbi:hypothetical protein IFM89_030461 [Coptis chinensis]|uniref:Reverse transcriptase n=1 Tax=Coptis chinensis TaxID=261450 RepID=A0A835H9U2_9MAGN|nr:hypothetical protein IFM89_030461 [Coptis chinensis]